MLNETPAEPRGTAERLEKQPPTAPAISLPRGGGAIRGMGERFAADPATGTSSMPVSIATSPSSSGFGPRLALSYDSGPRKVRKLSSRADLCTLVGLSFLKGHHLTRGRLGLLLSSLFALLTPTSCDTWPKSHLKVPPVSPEAYQTYKMDIDRKKNILEQTGVKISGGDIQLPITAGNLAPQENRTYYYYVEADNLPGGTTLKDLWNKKEFWLEVTGVKASIVVPDYLPAVGPTSEPLPSVTNGLNASTIQALNSRNLLLVKVRSQDLTGPFAIEAWFPEEYQEWARRHGALHTNRLAKNVANPWGQRREIKVYNGDLRTTITIEAQRNAEASFGKLFAQYFYVARVNLRNLQTDKRLIVYTTTLRAIAITNAKLSGTFMIRVAPSEKDPAAGTLKDSHGLE